MDIKTLRHSAAHILAHAVKNLFPKIKLGIGPTTEEGFYYDFDKKEPFTPVELNRIEQEMRKLIKKNHDFKKVKLTSKEIQNFLKKEPYKKELFNDLKRARVKATFYKNGDFLDLCAGPHIKKSGQIKAFKLLKVAGAYWKGESKNKQLQRIYGTAYPKESELKSYLNMLKEAEKRNHVKLGKQMDLFSIHPEGPGLPFFHNKGMIIINELIKFWREKHKNNYQEIRTPTILSKELWETSGHWGYYKENMYTTKIDNQEFAIKPMNCPGGMLAYKENLHSYKELPMRVAEIGHVHRHELSGVLNGLFRVRAFTQDDAHIFCTGEQLQDEVIGVINLIKDMYSKIGFKKYVYTLSIRGPKKKSKYLGTNKQWNWAEQTLAKALKKLKLDYEIMEGEAKFYGPSLDIVIKDALGREWQCGTVQLDFNLTKRFNITYESKQNKKETPFMLHRVVYGSLERFIGILIEHYAGKFPAWLAPVQVKIITVTDKNIKFAKQIEKLLKENNIRVELDERAETIGKKVREAEIYDKPPYLITIGDKETKSKTLAIRDRKNKVKFKVKPNTFLQQLQKEIENKKC